jgi:iron complex transport system ATP-binding protein
MSPVIEAESVGVQIGRKALLDGVSLAISAGETVALVGPNGAGKSTLLRALSGEIAPTSGTVRLKGREPRSYGPRLLALHRAVLSQSVTVAFPFTVAEVVRMGAGERSGPAVDAMVDRALGEVDLDTFRDRIIGTLSGGEQQRAHFARVMVQLACGEAAHGPGVLLLDEPTASLDLRHQLDIVEVARRCVGRGITVIAILHDLNLAALFAGRIVVLHDGRLAGDGPPAQIVNDAMLERVFGVRSAVGRVPAENVPFVLPHHASKA